MFCRVSAHQHKLAASPFTIDDGVARFAAGWRAVPHPGSQAVFCVNDATGEHMWLPADVR
jgi:hypothetical protein